MQTIFIGRDPETHIRTYFDLDFLRNLYTSSRLLHQVSRLNTGRLTRYTERGFAIDPWFPEHDVIAMHDTVRWTMDIADEDYARALKTWRKRIHDPIAQACRHSIRSFISLITQFIE